MSLEKELDKLDEKVHAEAQGLIAKIKADPMKAAKVAGIVVVVLVILGFAFGA